MSLGVLVQVDQRISVTIARIVMNFLVLVSWLLIVQDQRALNNKAATLSTNGGKDNRPFTSKTTYLILSINILLFTINQYFVIHAETAQDQVQTRSNKTPPQLSVSCARLTISLGNTTTNMVGLL